MGVEVCVADDEFFVGVLGIIRELIPRGGPFGALFGHAAFQGVELIKEGGADFEIRPARVEILERLVECPRVPMFKIKLTNFFIK